MAADRAFALIQILALNGIALYGVYFLGWSWGTALVLYWCETLLGTFFIALRIVLHRRLTHKRGYYRAQLGIKQNDRPFSSFLPEFLTGSLVFNLGHGLFLFVILFMLRQNGETGAALHLAALQKGVTAMALVMLGSFALDCQNLRDRPFAWIRALAQRSMGRTMVVHLAIVLGMFGVMMLKTPRTVFYVFAFFKILFELGGLSAGQKTPEEAPAWAAKIGRLVPGGEEGIRAQYRQEARREEGLAEEDEEERPA